MPNIWTHMLFCEDLADTIKNPNPLSQYEAYMNIGAQGPDPFFYHNFWPWIKNDPVQEIGNQLHTKHCGEFLMSLITAAKYKQAEVQAYVFGFVTHHILDRNAHPFVHYHAGYEGNNHQRLEIAIDTIMMEKYHNLKTWKVPVYKEIDVGRSLNKEIVHILHTAINQHYPELQSDSASYIQKAYRDMKLALRLLADPYSWKNTIFKSLVSSYSHQPVKNDVDYLNLNKNTWHHPATYDVSDKSFLDLYEQGRAEGIEIMTLIMQFWYSSNHTCENKIADLIGNISYDTGIPLALNLENQYAEPII